MAGSAETLRPPLRIWIGWNPAEDDAYAVARFSLERRTSVPVAIAPLRQDELRQRGLYSRPPDPLASTEFTYTRFLTPLLAGFEGWALFCDCDFLWLGDVADLFALADPSKAVLCVQHDHQPSETSKMQGAVQTRYPRKNWSSLMLFNCAHPAARRLTASAVNGESAAWLHRMQWAADTEIGALPETWNWLEGWNAPPPSGPPQAVHYTRGGPWFADWQDVAYAGLWRAEFAALRARGA